MAFSQELQKAQRQAASRAARAIKKDASERPLPGIFGEFRAQLTIETKRILWKLTDDAQIAAISALFSRWWLANKRNECPMTAPDVNRAVVESVDTIRRNPQDEIYARRTFTAQPVQTYPQYFGKDGYL